MSGKRAHPANDILRTMNTRLDALGLTREERSRVVTGLLPVLDIALDEMNLDLADIKRDLDSIERRQQARVVTHINGEPVEEALARGTLRDGRTRIYVERRCDCACHHTGPRSPSCSFCVDRHR